MKIKTTTIRTINAENLKEYIDTLNNNLGLVGSPNYLDLNELKQNKKIEYTDENAYTKATTTIEIITENDNCK